MAEVIRNIFILVVLGLTGFAAGRSKYLPENSGVVLSRIVIKLTAPLLIFTTLISKDFSAADGIWIYLLGLIFIFFSYAVALIICKVLKLEGTVANIYRMNMMFGNVLFLAIPLLGSKALFGEQGVIYAVFFGLANDTVLWTMGIYLVNKHKSGSTGSNLKHLVNGNTLAFASGLLLIFLNIRGFAAENYIAGQIYSFILDAFKPLGNTTIYLSMLFIGLILSEVKISGLSDIVRRYPVFILSFSKLIFIPCIALFVLSLFGDNINNVVKGVVVLQVAMPCGTIVSALAAQHDSDYKLATENIFFTTVLSVITLPLMVLLVKAF